MFDVWERIQNGPVLEREVVIFRKRFELITQKFFGKLALVVQVRFGLKQGVKNVVFTPEGFPIDEQNCLALDRVKFLSVSGT